MAIGIFHSIMLPWPEAPTDSQYRAAGSALGISIATNTPTVSEKAQVDAVMGLLSARIQQYAPGAPLAVRREAATRFWGYLAQAAQPSVGAVDLGHIKQTPPYSHAAAFRNSGVAALLAPWRIRRAGLVEEADS